MSNISRALAIEYAEDVERIRREIPMLSGFSAIVVERLWQRFSDDACAQWLGVNKEWLSLFKEWLEK